MLFDDIVLVHESHSSCQKLQLTKDRNHQNNIPTHAFGLYTFWILNNRHAIYLREKKSKQTTTKNSPFRTMLVYVIVL